MFFHELSAYQYHRDKSLNHHTLTIVVTEQKREVTLSETGNIIWPFGTRQFLGTFKLDLSPSVSTDNSFTEMANVQTLRHMQAL